MKPLMLFLFIDLGIGLSFAQTNSIDSLINKIYEEKTDSGRIRRIYDIHNSVGQIDSRNVIICHKKMLELAKKKSDMTGQAVILAELGYTTYRSGNTTQGTAMILDALKLAEKTGNQQAIGIAYNNLGICQPDIEKSKGYRYKALKASLAANDYLFACWDMEGLSRMFSTLGQVDSAMYFAQSAYTLASARHIEPVLPGCLQNLGDLQYRMGNKPLALEFYRTALLSPFAVKDQKTKGDIYFSIADYYRNEKIPDSAFFYANLSYEILKDAFYSYTSAPAKLLWKLYEGRNSDSALKYSGIFYAVRDSVYSIQRITQLQAMAVQEEERQLNIKEERKNNLQYIAIVIGLLTFIILFFALSRSIIVKEKFISFFGILGLLALFEFINLFIHPYLAHFTNDSPVLMLLILIGIGALLVPLHHRMEKWATAKLVEKNKQIRLAAAKKTIRLLSDEQLENNQT